MSRYRLKLKGEAQRVFEGLVAEGLSEADIMGKGLALLDQAFKTNRAAGKAPSEIPSVTGFEMEKTRAVLAIVAVGTFIGLIVIEIGLGWLLGNRPAADVVAMLTATGSVLGGIVGAIIGFYFRQES